MWFSCGAQAISECLEDWIVMACDQSGLELSDVSACGTDLRI